MVVFTVWKVKTLWKCYMAHPCCDVCLPQGHICYQKRFLSEFGRNSLLVDTAVWVYKGLSCHDCIIQVLDQWVQEEGDKCWGGLVCPLSPSTALCSSGVVVTFGSLQGRAQQQKPLHPPRVPASDLPLPQLGPVSSPEPLQCVYAQLAVPTGIRAWKTLGMLVVTARNLLHVHQHCSATKAALGTGIGLRHSF